MVLSTHASGPILPGSSLPGAGLGLASVGLSSSRSLVLEWGRPPFLGPQAPLPAGKASSSLDLPQHPLPPPLRGSCEVLVLFVSHLGPVGPADNAGSS